MNKEEEEGPGSYGCVLGGICVRVVSERENLSVFFL
jgi:hypothetical protein